VKYGLFLTFFIILLLGFKHILIFFNEMSKGLDIRAGATTLKYLQSAATKMSEVKCGKV
jgi:hypothetical protein